MKEQFEFAKSALRIAPLGLKAVAASALRAMEVKPSAIETSCEPIVLMHGFAGFRELEVFNWTLIEYFKGVRQQLSTMGYQVFAPEVVPFDDPLDRAKQWFSAIEKIRAETGAEKVHLVGHSQGGLDARVLVAPSRPAQNTPLGPLLGLGYGPHVASLTTIATPHLGSPIVDEIDQDVPVHQEAVDRALDLVGLLAQLVKRDPQDVERAVKALSRKFMIHHFNPIIEDDPNVACYAVAGDPISLDVVHPLLRPLYRAIREMDSAEGGGPNDGLVTVASACFGNLPPAHEGQEYPELAAPRRSNWGTLGVVQADHVAEVGIPLRFRPSDTYDHIAFFAGLAQFLDPGYTADLVLRKDGRWVRTPKSRPKPVSVAAVHP